MQNTATLYKAHSDIQLTTILHGNTQSMKYSCSWKCHYNFNSSTNKLLSVQKGYI